MYLQAMLMAAAAYYVTVLILYFRNDIRRWVTGKQRRSLPPKTEPQFPGAHWTAPDQADP